MVIAPARRSNIRERFPKAGTGIAPAALAIALGLAGAPAPALAADTANGAKLWGIHCRACHGNGRGAMPGAPDLVRSNALLRPDGALLASLRAGRGAMPGYLGVLRDRELFDVIAYMRTLN